jgi:hypothetical protein
MTDPERVERLLEQLMPCPPAPPDLAARVLAAARSGMRSSLEEPPPPRRSPRVWAWAGSAAALAAAVIIAFVVRGPARRPVAAGLAHPHVRQTVRIAPGVIAVVQPGGEIAWRTQGGRLRVEQRRGDVSYEIDAGHPALVASPVGEVVAHGTRFRLALRGPFGSTAAYVHLMEGAVELRSPGGVTTVGTGEWARMAAGFAPQRMPAGALPSALEPAPTPDLAPPEAPSGETPPLPERRKVFGFSAEERLAMARRCNFRWGLPRTIVRPELSELDPRVALTAGERAAVVRVLEQHRAEYFDRLRGLYREVTGAAAVPPNLGALGLFRAIDEHASKVSGRMARRRILLEWAGELEPSTDQESLPAIERFWRLEVRTLDDLEGRLTAVLGPARARELTERMTGYGSTGIETGCPSGRR